MHPLSKISIQHAIDLLEEARLINARALSAVIDPDRTTEAELAVVTNSLRTCNSITAQVDILYKKLSEWDDKFLHDDDQGLIMMMLDATNTLIGQTSKMRLIVGHGTKSRASQLIDSLKA